MKTNLKTRILLDIQAGMTIQEAAKEAGVNRRTISRWRRRDQEFDSQVRLLKMLLKALPKIEAQVARAEKFITRYGNVGKGP